MWWISPLSGPVPSKNASCTSLACCAEGYTKVEVMKIGGLAAHIAVAGS
jgi:hypothetical protein